MNLSKYINLDIEKDKLNFISSFEAELSISQEKAKGVITQLINKFLVKDINIKDVTLEEIIEGVFKV